MLKTTNKQWKNIRKKLCRECCNYQKGKCLLLDFGYECPCIQSHSKCRILCKYFLSSVLPKDQKLYHEILKQNEGETKK